MSATFLTVLLLLAYNFALLAASVATESVSVGPPPALAPGQAPPLPNQGALAEPRSLDQVGFPAALTASVIPPAS